MRATALRDGPSLRRALGAFAEDTYLHQVVERTPTGTQRYTDLPEALAAADAAGPMEREWRVHFHVPIFLGPLGSLETTQAYLASVLRLLKADPFCPCLEVE